NISAAAVVGLPIVAQGRLFNAAAVVADGRILGLVPKTHLPNYSEFYEQRWFANANELNIDEFELEDEVIPIGTDLLFEFGAPLAFTMGIEICEDLWAVEPPSGQQSLAGATVIVNPSASNELLGKADYR